MNPQSNYEQARDEAANEYAKNQGYFTLHPFKAGAYFGRSYERNLNADLLADNKLMREALEFYRNKKNYEYKEFSDGIQDRGDFPVMDDQGTKARQTLSQLKGKYDE